MEISYAYTKLRKHFGRQPLFSERRPELCDSIAPDPSLQALYIMRNPVHEHVQNTPKYSEVEINTIRAVYANTGVNHREGGWPRDVNNLDPEATQRYRRKIEKDEDYINCVKKATPGMEHYIRQNNAIDLYHSYYTKMAPMPPPEQVGCRTVNIFKISESPRAVNSICWQPNGGSHFAVSYVNLDYNHNAIGPTTAFIWNIENPSAPLCTIDPPATILDLQFNPRDSNMLVGGLVTGQNMIFDQRALGKPVTSTSSFSTYEQAVITPAYTSHREMVRRVIFIHSKTGTEFFSGSSDGTLKWWDVRNLEEPLDEQILHVVENNSQEPKMSSANGVATIQYEQTIPTRYMVGTENGRIICGNRKGKTHVEKLPATFDAHHGSIKSLERNPQFLKNFMTVGDWSMKIWSEECKESCILRTPSLRIGLTCATWSPTRVSLISSLLFNGQFAAWDLLRNQNGPIFTQQICPEALIKVAAHEAGSLVACGSKMGNIYLVELTPSLSNSDNNDKALLAAVFERESKRERLLESRQREIRLRLRQAEEAVTSTSPRSSEVDLTIGDRDLMEASQEYMTSVRREQAIVY